MENNIEIKLGTLLVKKNTVEIWMVVEMNQVFGTGKKTVAISPMVNGNIVKDLKQTVVITGKQEPLESHICRFNYGGNILPPRNELVFHVEH